MMTAEQEGGYIRLLCYCWDSGDCSLPDNEEQLIVMARISKGGWKMVGKCFEPHPEKQGFLTNKKLYDILHEQVAWKKKSSIGGKKSAAKRAENNKNSKGGWKMVATKSNPSSSSASSSATANIGEVSPITPLPVWLPMEQWSAFKEMRKRIRKPMTDHAEKLALKKLQKFHADGKDVAAILDYNILNNYQGVFEPKGESHGKSTFDQAGLKAAAAICEEFVLEAQHAISDKS